MPADRGFWTADLAKALAAALCLGAGAVAAQDDGDVPDDAFLEFLGTWEDSEGNWMDPLEFESFGGPRQTPESREPDDEWHDAPVDAGDESKRDQNPDDQSEDAHRQESQSEDDESEQDSA